MRRRSRGQRCSRGTTAQYVTCSWQDARGWLHSHTQRPCMEGGRAPSALSLLEISPRSRLSTREYNQNDRLIKLSNNCNIYIINLIDLLMNERNKSLLLGSERGDIDMVKIAIENGSDVNAKDCISLRRMILFSNTRTNSSSQCFL